MTPEERIVDAVGDPAIAQDLIDLALLRGVNLDAVANLLENGVKPDTVAQLINNGTNLNDAIAIMNQGADLNLIGTSRDVGNFVGLRGASVNDVMARIPTGAKINEWKTVVRGAKDGMKFKWKDASGNTWRLEMHGPDIGAPEGANASSGWVLRVKRGKYYMDTGGIFYKEAIGNPDSLNYNPSAINETHIPIQEP